MSNSLPPHRLQWDRVTCSSLSHGFCSNSCLLSQWSHPTISSFITPFSSCFQSFPASGSFPVSWLFTSGGQSIGAPASASVLPMNIQGWFPLVLTGLISLLSKGFSGVCLWASFKIWYTGEKSFNLCHRLSSFLSSFHITALHCTPETNIMNQLYFDKKIWSRLS